MADEKFTEEYFAKEDAEFARKFNHAFKILRNMIFGVIIAVAIFVLAFFIDLIDAKPFISPHKCL